jgi:hypothetical protein
MIQYLGRTDEPNTLNALIRVLYCKVENRLPSAPNVNRSGITSTNSPLFKEFGVIDSRKGRHSQSDVTIPRHLN